MEENNIFTGKTLEEAVNNACLALGHSKDELEVEVLEEGKKKLFGSVKWKIKATEKQSDADRAAEYVEGLLKIMGVEAVCEASVGDNAINIEIKTTDGSRVIGKRGEVLDAIQCIAGAVANIGREKYAKVVVDCENYRSRREETLKTLAEKAAKKAVETGRKVTLEPMNPYERRIIHSALSDGEEVKTVSEGKEPARYVAIIPANLKEGEKPLRFYDNEKKAREHGNRRFVKNGKGGKSKNVTHGERGGRGARPPRKDRGAKPASGEKRAKKEIRFGTYLGNSGAGKGEE